MDRRRLLQRLMNGALQNVAFEDFVDLARGFGFQPTRISGSHHIFRHPATGAKLNLQPVRGQAKAYQIRQLLRVVEELHLTLEEEA